MGGCLRAKMEAGDYGVASQVPGGKCSSVEWASKTKGAITKTPVGGIVK